MPSRSKTTRWTKRLVSLGRHLSFALVALIIAGVALIPAPLVSSAQKLETQGASRAPGRAPDDSDVYAASVGGTAASPFIDPADCTGTESLTNVGISRYFLSVASASGPDINNASGRIVANSQSFTLPLPGQPATQPP